MSCYDIVCQWWINLKKRLLLLPAAVRWTLILGLVRFVIPKLHIKGHKIPCQDHYSLELVPGSAQTDGEGIERPWAHIGGVGSSTKEMGPGSREDTLNGHWGSWNWQKLVGIGERLRTKRDGQHVAGWQKMVEEFESDATKQNPYWMTRRGLTEADVLLEFEREESPARGSSGVPSIHAVSPSSRRVRVQVELKKAGTTAQQLDIVGLRRFSQSQPPSPAGSTSAYNALRNPGRWRAGEAVAGLAAIESSLRDAQLSSSLELLRRKLHVKSRLVTYKSLQARAQGANTRSRGLSTAMSARSGLHSEKFQMAWEAKRLLTGGDAEAVGWRKLLKEDIRCMQDAEELARNALRHEGELPPLTTDEEEERVVRGGEKHADLEEALRIEWCKAYARTRRWREEMLLVEEEVRRAGVTLEFRAREWEARAGEGAEGAIACGEAGVKRRMVYDDEWVDEEGGTGRSEIPEDELEDVRGDDVADDDFILGGGADED
ncbi:hypothetical protein B0H14DRAFT_3512709 [Mycena olivaceomarginata]|nr:hypothetical protein B0H14DRAFT_3512709 [Mycena olivaceomarginata]